MRVLIAAFEEAIPLLILPHEDRASVTEKLKLIQRSVRYGKKKPPKLVFVQNLAEAFFFLKEGKTPSVRKEAEVLSENRPKNADSESEELDSLLPLSESLRRIIEVSIAGSHHLLLLGPRGAGKSHALHWWRALQFEAEADTQIEQALTRELSEPFAQIPGKIGRTVGVHARPQALIGSCQGSLGNPRWIPGEFSKAHGGALFADELPEWNRDTREAFREPLERGMIRLNRQESLEFPARFTLVATGNSCACGGWPKSLSGVQEREARSKRKICHCMPHEESAYQKRLSGPILDRIDLVSWVIPKPHEKREALSIESLKARLNAASSKLSHKYGDLPGRLSAHALESILKENPRFLSSLLSLEGSSLRSRHKILRIALTLSAFDEGEGPENHHFLEASYYRPEALGLGLE
jgi:magnesium chelatase family protein